MAYKDVDEIIVKMETQIAGLEGSVPEQQIRIMKDELKLLKLRQERSNIILGQEDLIP